MQTPSMKEKLEENNEEIDGFLQLKKYSAVVESEVAKLKNFICGVYGS